MIKSGRRIRKVLASLPSSNTEMRIGCAEPGLPAVCLSSIEDKAGINKPLLWVGWGGDHGVFA